MSRSPRTMAYSLDAILMLASFAFCAGGFVKDVAVESAEALAAMGRKLAPQKPRSPAQP